MFHVEQQASRRLLRSSKNNQYETIRPPSASLCPGFIVISLARYSALLTQPALRSAFAASMLGRLPIGIAGLSILMLARDSTGSFGSAGAVAAWYVAGLAATAPILGRVIDRYGPRSTLFSCALAFPSALAALVVALSVPAPLWLAFALAAAACGCAGTLLFRHSAAMRQWRTEPQDGANLLGPLAEPGFVPLLAVIVCYASAFGLVEIGTIAFATEAQSAALAGVLLGIMSIGSAAGGIVYGSRSWRLPLARQFPRMLALMGLGVGPLALWSASWAFGLWCLVAGVAMAPALIMQSMLVARNSRPEHSTEAFTWSTTGLLAGVGLGLTAGGALLEFAKSPAVFAAAAGLSVAAGAMALQLVRTRN
jgi:predicted MFS family arabinose efflux permease